MANEQKFQNKDITMRILENEHLYLQFLMDEWYLIVRNFQEDFYSIEEAPTAFQTLVKLIIQFIEPWKNHVEKEEKYYFPMLGNYIGKEQGPIVGIEAEHSEIDAFIGHFLHHARVNVEKLTLDEMKQMSKDIGEAYELLLVHFVKEETVLFPMTDRVMKAVDQDKLLEQLNTLII